MPATPATEPNEGFPHTERICRIVDPVQWTAPKRDLMVRACREMAVFHAANCPPIRQIYERHGFDPRSIETEADLARIPPIGVTALKYHLLTSLPHDRASLQLTSSGTGGQKTRVWFDGPSLDRVMAMLEGLWREEGLIAESPTNYLMFVYDPADADDLGISFSIQNQQRFAPPRRTFFAIGRGADGGWEFRRQALHDHLCEFIAEGLPVRLSGIPSFIFEFLNELKEQGPVQLPAGSFMFTGGGWKAAEDRSVSRDAFRSRVSHLLGLPTDRIRDGYGMAEHSAPYLECAEHRFHVPVYNRVLTRCPETMASLPAGSPGLLQLITPFNAMMPTLALLTTDMGMIETEPCPCGRRSPTFVLLGRAGLSKHKGCALQADEIVRRR